MRGDPDILVVGGGPAGVAAATAAAESGLSVILSEMRASLGGAIHRQPAPGSKPIAHLPSLRGRWQSLRSALTASGAEVATRRSFIGIDSTGAVMIDNRVTGQLEIYRPRALILACGALEEVRPRPGWQLPGVVTAGGLQVMLKEGCVPKGRILIAGSGPLLLALATQLTAAGQPPVAVVEGGNPIARPLVALGLLASPSILPDVATLMQPMLMRRFPWWRSTEVETIEQSGDGLAACLRLPNGRIRRIEIDRIALHDGLRSNDFGLPTDGARDGLIVLRVGDVREVLGAHAAEEDGRRAGIEAAMRIKGQAPPAAVSAIIVRERRLQAKLAAIFQPPDRTAAVLNCPDETVICRCENRTLGELKAQLSGRDTMSARELRLNGRFGMGACQGRFCLPSTLSIMAALQPDTIKAEATEVAGQRWPLRPVSLSALADADLAPDRQSAMPS
jgi:hypothetical protein